MKLTLTIQVLDNVIDYNKKMLFNILTDTKRLEIENEIKQLREEKETLQKLERGGGV